MGCQLRAGENTLCMQDACCWIIVGLLFSKGQQGADNDCNRIGKENKQFVITSLKPATQQKCSCICARCGGWTDHVGCQSLSAG